MDITLKKSGKISGIIEVPADKSITHRAVMLSSLATGQSVISNYLPSDDCLRTVEAFRQMGVKIKIAGKTLFIDGIGMRLQKPAKEIYAGNSGTTARLICGVLAGQSFNSTITGDASLTKRPMKRVIDPLSEMGAKIKSSGGFLPLIISGGQKLKGIKYKSDKSSAQVKSAVLLAGLYAGSATTYIEPVKSRDHSERMLAAFGAKVSVSGNEVTIEPSGKLNSQNITVPGDISSAAFFIVAALIVSGSQITIKRVGVNPTRDGIIEALLKMGADITLSNAKEVSGEPVADITVRYSKLKAVDIDAQIIPRMVDEVPVFALAAARAYGITRITGAGELRVKESDRIKAVVSELSKIGVDISELEDGFVINGRPDAPLKGAVVESFEDHRIAMTLAVASLIAEGEMTVKNADCVNISFPEFYETLEKVKNAAKETAPVLYLIGKYLSKAIAVLFYRLKIEGAENIPKTGGVIISPNHLSYFDPPLTGAAMKRPLYFMAKEDLFKIPVLGFLIKRTNAFPVKRGAMDMRALRNAFKILEEGHALLMFPEGTRSKDGKMLKARPGAGMAACNVQVPIVPVKIENTNKMFFFKKIKIKYGKPIMPPKNFTKDDYAKLSQKILDIIRGMEA